MSLQDHSIHAWIVENGVVNEMGRPIEFDSHFFLFDILSDWSKRIRVLKCTQIGLSTVGILKTAYATQKKPWNVIYTLPTDNDVYKFVPQKFDKMATNNREAFGGKMDPDTTTQKGIGDRFVTFQGTVSKTAVLMLTADWLVRDEIDRSNLSVLEGMESRVGGADSWGGIMDLSNPSTPGIGIDAAYEDSDRKAWHVTCDKCGKVQELTFEDNVDRSRRMFVCSGCDRELSTTCRNLGFFKPMNEGNPNSGYHISQLMAPWVSAGRIIDDFENKEPEYFYNFTLGKAYADSESVVGPEVLLDNWNPNFKPEGDWYLGVDVGRTKHYALGTDRGLVKVGRFEEWSELDDIIATYRPFTVIDAMPERTMSDEYRNRYPGTVWICFYNKDRAKGEMAQWGKGDDYGIVYADRSRLIGQTVHDFQAARLDVAVRPGPELKLLVKHFCTIRKLKEEQTRLLTKVESVLNVQPVVSHVWTTVSAEDHYAHAVFYYRLALSAGSSPAYATEPRGGGADAITGDPGSPRTNLKEAMLDEGYVEN